MSQSTLKTESLTPAAVSNVSDWDILQRATQQLNKILIAERLCARISLANESTFVGEPTVFNSSPVEFAFTSRRTFVRLFRRMRLIDFAMGYFNGDFVVRGPISKAIDILDAMNGSTDQKETITEFCWRLLVRSLKVLVPQYAKKFESLDHYSQSADAYESFLGDHMQYTCGRFEQGHEDITIDEAQVAKFRFIESLATKYIGSLAGKDHLDIGCGWGGMDAFFQKEFGTRTLGNTNCKEQMEYAKRRYGVEIFLGDYSKLRHAGRRFDLITIVGMIEHLTPYRRSKLLNIVGGVLRPGGVVYLQCICKPQTWIGGDAYRVVKRQIFPGHFLETPEQTEVRLKKSGFTILESFDHHRDYGITTSRWVDNVQANEEELIRILKDPRRYRMYLGYLAYASKLFYEGHGCLMRYVFTKS